MKIVRVFRNIRIFLIVLLLLIVIDGFVIGTVTSDFYARELKDITRMKDGMIEPIWWTASLIYLLIAFGLTYYVVLRNEKSSELDMFLKGALFGFVFYTGYSLTNYALLNDWNLTIVFLDVIWGTALGGAVALTAFMINQLLE